MAGLTWLWVLAEAGRRPLYMAERGREATFEEQCILSLSASGSVTRRDYFFNWPRTQGEMSFKVLGAFKQGFKHCFQYIFSC